MLTDMLSEDIPLYTSLSIINEEGNDVYGSVFKRQIDLLCSKMKESSSISLAFENFIPEDELTILKTAEKSGNLIQGFDSIRTMLKNKEDVKKAIFSALVTPSILFLVVLAVIAGYSQKVFPAFITVLPVEKWPGITQSLFSFGTFLFKGGALGIILSIISLVILLKFLQPNYTGMLRSRIFDKTPLFFYYKRVQTAILLNSISALMANDVPLVEAINIIKNQSNRWMRSYLDNILEKMTQNSNYKDAFDVDLLSKESLLIVSIYAPLDSFGLTMRKLAQKEQSGVVNSITVLSSRLKTLSTLILASAVIWIFTGIFSLVDKLSTNF